MRSHAGGQDPALISVVHQQEYNLTTYQDCHGSPYQTGHRSWFYFGVSGHTKVRVAGYRILQEVLHAEGTISSRPLTARQVTGFFFNSITNRTYVYHWQHVLSILLSPDRHGMHEFYHQMYHWQHVALIHTSLSPLTAMACRASSS